MKYRSGDAHENKMCCSLRAIGKYINKSLIIMITIQDMGITVTMTNKTCIHNSYYLGFIKPMFFFFIFYTVAEEGICWFILFVVFEKLMFRGGGGGVNLPTPSKYATVWLYKETIDGFLSAITQDAWSKFARKTANSPQNSITRNHTMMMRITAWF